LAWQGLLLVLQLVQPAMTSGPSRLPHTSGFPLLLDVDVVELALLELLVVGAAPPWPPAPHASAVGTQTWSCWPSAPERVVQVRLGSAHPFLEQSGAQ
jgi:hypothetical protein